MNTFLANLYLRSITVRDREEGQAMAEYGLIIGLVAVLLIAALIAVPAEPRGRLQRHQRRNLDRATCVVAISHSPRDRHHMTLRRNKPETQIRKRIDSKMNTES